ncbi:hypothetical protein ACWD0F_51535, partial [Nonomuraea sp. NPDC002799]
GTNLARPSGVAKASRNGRGVPDEVLRVLGHRTAADGVTGYYPAFDVTPPDLVTRIVTARGAHLPDRLKESL